MTCACDVTYMKHEERLEHGFVLIIDLSCILANPNVDVTLDGGHTAVM